MSTVIIINDDDFKPPKKVKSYSRYCICESRNFYHYWLKTNVDVIKRADNIFTWKVDLSWQSYFGIIWDGGWECGLRGETDRGLRPSSLAEPLGWGNSLPERWFHLYTGDVISIRVRGVSWGLNDMCVECLGHSEHSILSWFRCYLLVNMLFFFIPLYFKIHCQACASSLWFLL